MNTRTIEAVTSRNGDKIHLSDGSFLMCQGNGRGVSHAARKISSATWEVPADIEADIAIKLAVRADFTATMRASANADYLCSKCFGKAGK